MYSQVELPSAPPFPSMFDTIDKNHDGFITREEFAGHFKPIGQHLQPVLSVSTAASGPPYSGGGSITSGVSYGPSLGGISEGSWHGGSLVAPAYNASSPVPMAIAAYQHNPGSAVSTSTFAEPVIMSTLEEPVTMETGHAVCAFGGASLPNALSLGEPAPPPEVVFSPPGARNGRLSTASCVAIAPPLASTQGPQGRVSAVSGVPALPAPIQFPAPPPIHVPAGGPDTSTVLVPKKHIHTVEKLVEVPQVHFREVIKEVPVQQIEEVIREVPIPQVVEVIKEVKVPVIQTVEKIVEVPHMCRTERVVEVPETMVEEVVRHVVKHEVQEVVHQVPKIQVETVERIVEVPEIRYQEKIVENVEKQVREVVRRMPKVEVKEVVKQVPRIQVQQVERIVVVPQVHQVEKLKEVSEVRVKYLPPKEAVFDPVPRSVGSLQLPSNAKVDPRSTSVPPSLCRASSPLGGTVLSRTVQPGYGWVMPPGFAWPQAGTPHTPAAPVLAAPAGLLSSPRAVSPARPRPSQLGMLPTAPAGLLSATRAPSPTRPRPSQLGILHAAPASLLSAPRALSPQRLRPAGLSTMTSASLIGPPRAAPSACPSETPLPSQLSTANTGIYGPAMWPWCQENSFFLCGREELNPDACRCLVIDPAVTSSVTQAVDMLNAGRITCDDQWVVVFSRSCCEWYVIFRHGAKDAALNFFTEIGM